MTQQAMPGMGRHRGAGRPARDGDGVTLYADVYRPAEAALTRPAHEPSRTTRPAAVSSFVGYAHPSWYARRGYVVVGQDCRGRYRSEGDVLPVPPRGGRRRADDRLGEPLPGTTAGWRRTASPTRGSTSCSPPQRPRGLAAIAPAFTGGSPYEDWFYRQGAFALAFAAGVGDVPRHGRGRPPPGRRGARQLAGCARQRRRPSRGCCRSRPTRRSPAATRPSTTTGSPTRPTTTTGRRSTSTSPDRRARPARRGLVGRVRPRHGQRLPRARPPGRAPQKLVLGPGCTCRGGRSVAPRRRRRLVVDDWQLRFWRPGARRQGERASSTRPRPST